MAVSNDTLPELAETFDVAISGIGITAGAAASVTTTIAASDGPVDSVNGVAVAGGDFSNTGLAPTDLGILTEGETTILANQQGDDEPGGRDRDYFTFTVAEGQELTGIILTGYTPGESTFPGLHRPHDGAQIITNPVTFADAGTLKGGFVYNTGDMQQNLTEGGLCWNSATATNRATPLATGPASPRRCPPAPTRSGSTRAASSRPSP